MSMIVLLNLWNYDFRLTILQTLFLDREALIVPRREKLINLNY